MVCAYHEICFRRITFPKCHQEQENLIQILHTRRSKAKQTKLHLERPQGGFHGQPGWQPMRNRHVTSIEMKCDRPRDAPQWPIKCTFSQPPPHPPSELRPLNGSHDPFYFSQKTSPKHSVGKRGPSILPDEFKTNSFGLNLFEIAFCGAVCLFRQRRCDGDW